MSTHDSLGAFTGPERDACDARKQLCACASECGDVAESDDDPRAVCKNLPLPPREPLVEIVLVHRGR